uniref:Uncharacterized protein n=1 Tax=Candidatus Kentrum sp. FM TaxID=2126340 RepID=A0A450W0H3_9GAMM|nr:MAG: hypothetical protein BECKFM1743A_GA0114220_104751 [Candidatus Kentron sp. FM]VFK10577.1 MAG: hypothetical protein BECKFM1743B_GA0114221_101456 [Candidatus Kentron sp. FM]
METTLIEKLEHKTAVTGRLEPSVARLDSAMEGAHAGEDVHERHGACLAATKDTPDEWWGSQLE